MSNPQFSHALALQPHKKILPARCFLLLQLDYFIDLILQPILHQHLIFIFKGCAPFAESEHASLATEGYFQYYRHRIFALVASVQSEL